MTAKHEQEREELERHVAEFLERGGVIQEIPSEQMSTDILGRTKTEAEQQKRSARNGCTAAQRKWAGSNL